MELVVTEYVQCNLIEINGRIDSNTAPQVETVLNALMIDDHYNIIVNLEDITFLSSSGILTFVNAQRKLKQQNKGEIIFVNVPDLVYGSFELAGFHVVFRFFDDIVTAVGQF